LAEYVALIGETNAYDISVREHHRKRVTGKCRHKLKYNN
jgi:hypothetical protein